MDMGCFTLVLWECQGSRKERELWLLRSCGRGGSSWKNDILVVVG